MQLIGFSFVWTMAFDRLKWRGLFGRITYLGGKYWICSDKLHYLYEGLWVLLLLPF